MDERALERRRFLIVHNTAAGRGRRELLDAVCGHLASANAVTTVVQADCAETDRRLVMDACDSGQFDAIVAAGGDSTVRGVACGLVGRGLPLGIIPIGTGNVLAEEIGLARTPAAIAGCLLRGGTVPHLPGRAGNTLFLSMVGAGFDARVLSHLDMGWKHRLGKLAYGWPLVRELYETPRHFRAIIDGREVSCAWLVVTKVARYAGSFIIAPQQKLSAPGFHAMIISARTRRDMASVLAAVPLRSLARHPLVQIIACREAEVPGGQGVQLQVDGEPLSSDGMKIGYAAEKLHLIVPEFT